MEYALFGLLIGLMAGSKAGGSLLYDLWTEWRLNAKPGIPSTKPGIPSSLGNMTQIFTTSYPVEDDANSR